MKLLSGCQILGCFFNREAIEMQADAHCQNCLSGKDITQKATQPFSKSSYELHLTVIQTGYTAELSTQPRVLCLENQFAFYKNFNDCGGYLAIYYKH